MKCGNSCLLVSCNVVYYYYYLYILLCCTIFHLFQDTVLVTCKCATDKARGW